MTEPATKDLLHWTPHDRDPIRPANVGPSDWVAIKRADGYTIDLILAGTVEWNVVVGWRFVEPEKQPWESPYAKAAEAHKAKAEGIQATLNERGKTHGDFGEQSMTAQTLKGNLRGHPGWQGLRDEQRESLEMIVHKVSRILNGNPDEPDHWRDIAGYATLVENILVHGKSHNV